MANNIPLVVDRLLDPPKVRELQVATPIPADRLPLATGSTPGAITAAEKTQLAGTPAAIAAAVAGEAGLRAAADSAEAGARSSADSALDGRVSELEADVAALDPAGEENAGANLLTAAPLTPPEEQGLFVRRNPSTGALEFLALAPGAELQLERVGDTLVLGARPPLWTPPGSRARRGLGYRDVRRQGARTAGAQGDTTKLADNHGSANLYPRMLWAALDVYGFPHNRHKRLESDSTGNDSLELGYEFGHDIAAGDFRDGRGMIFHGRGRVQNAGWLDAFLDWALEFNPQAGVFNGVDRLRLVSPPLDQVWAGERLLDWRVELRVEAWRTFSAVGTWTIFQEDGTPARSWTREAELVSSVDPLADDLRVQLSWRVERDQATRLDVFDNANQGANQGANVLRCSVRTYALDWDGFPKD